MILERALARIPRIKDVDDFIEAIVTQVALGLIAGWALVSACGLVVVLGCRSVERLASLSRRGPVRAVPGGERLVDALVDVVAPIATHIVRGRNVLTREAIGTVSAAVVSLVVAFLYF